jgi:hypothetical protein
MTGSSVRSTNTTGQYFIELFDKSCPYYALHNGGSRLRLVLKNSCR